MRSPVAAADAFGFPQPAGRTRHSATQDVDVMSAVVARSQSGPGRGALSAGPAHRSSQGTFGRLAVGTSGAAPIASIRLYNAGPDDYAAQNRLASLRRVDALAAGGSAARAIRMVDVPGAAVLATGPVDGGTVVRAWYRYPSWKRGTAGLSGARAAAADRLRSRLR